ncbi:START-like domain-containing protein [Telluribacter humicola]|uniref:START-like domain-containing protein n=1 Tax=Telluribacter humicola TaxID=1720261 RepID=UPI001A958421|nr:START-like domain-containing protein [Telluribacter humicola]
MEKHKFVVEYELRSSPKVLFPYISTASGLEQWFAEKVKVLPDHRFDFQWDGDSHMARQTSHRLNKAVRYEFENTGETEFDLNYIEMKLEVSELTQSTYLRVVDYSQNADDQELLSMWNGLIESLKEIVGS